ncbi:hypothetical protein CAEBREN_23714 [Caenorhabditis brenneri]|uniref:Uncharacterized protein n=1 Tax=Caenorhabditis brenneri TaxID=135651 RepID=G0MKS4_CAEBE|nr:hypothetical protein CAEBREN_23714 [Caenorhabditis brenneri]
MKSVYCDVFYIEIRSGDWIKKYEYRTSTLNVNLLTLVGEVDVISVHSLERVGGKESYNVEEGSGDGDYGADSMNDAAVQVSMDDTAGHDSTGDAPGQGPMDE